MFVDKVQVEVVAGRGGNGIVSFRREKFVDKGGPDGGDGGKGGDIVAISSTSQDTLAEFRYKKRIAAGNGQNGGKQKKHGRSAGNTTILLPVGTLITNEDGAVIADLAQDNQQQIIASGGKGGFGNAHFVSSTRRVPKIAEKGEPGEALLLTFELKTIADVGLVGLPNAGKSTLLSKISNAKPEIADYPFTTLSPNLGVVDIDKKSSLVVADIPGLIEGASKGRGLGDEFLRHVERTKVLVHMIDVYNDDVALAYRTIQNELASYQLNLSKKPQIVVLNKIEGFDKERLSKKCIELKTVMPKNAKLYTISAKSGVGITDLLKAVLSLSAKTSRLEKRRDSKNTLPVIRLERSNDFWEVNKIKNAYVVEGKKIASFALRTDYENEAGVERLRDIMRKMGIMHELERQGIQSGDLIKIGTNGQIRY